MLLPFALTLFLSIFSKEADSADVNVTLANGSPIIGSLIFCKEGKYAIHEFISIPYAEPPIGKLRFMPPVQKRPWSEAKSCKGPKAGVVCVQESLGGNNKKLTMSENCLHLNIWVPKLHGNKQMPVMVFIHGGAFRVGGASFDLYNGTVLAAKTEIIIVSINYRLGVFGFVSLKEAAVEGNQGLLDQVLALKWIKANIGQFGGDPRKVTIFGESAGGASVGFHILSPLSTGLFQRAISQSGVPNCPRALMDQKEAYKRGFRLVEECGCNSSNHAPLDCLQNIDAKKLLSVDINVKDFPLMKFYPSIDGTFLPEHPIDIIKKGNHARVDLLIGHNSNEGWNMIISDWPDALKLSKNLSEPNFIINDELWETGVKHLLPPKMQMGSLAMHALIREYSRWEEPISAKSRQDTLEQLVSDDRFVCPIIKFANYISENLSVYFYKFNGISRDYLKFPDWMGSAHAADLEYIFGRPFTRTGYYTESEIQLSAAIQKAFTNFAKSGNPSSPLQTWPNYNQWTQYFMNFTESGNNISQWLAVNRCEFWNEFIQKLLMREENLT